MPPKIRGFARTSLVDSKADGILTQVSTTVQRSYTEDAAETVTTFKPKRTAGQHAFVGSTEILTLTSLTTLTKSKTLRI